MTPRPLASVTVEETDEGSFVILHTARGAQIRYGRFSADGVDAAISHLGSALATTAMRYQMVLRGADFGRMLCRQRRPTRAERSQ